MVSLSSCTVGIGMLWLDKVSRFMRLEAIEI